MVDALRGEKFVKNRAPTDGIAITPWETKLKDGPATIHIWDFGGQEIMHGTHQFFLTHRCIYLVMVDNRDDRGKKDAAYWLKLVRAFGGDSRVLVAMNKQTQIQFDLDRQDMSTKHGVALDHFFPTDCEKTSSIAPLRQAALKEAQKMLAARERFPKKWWDIKNDLAGMAEDYLSDSDYRSLCGKHGITDVIEQDRMLNDLTDLGIISSFPKDERLAELTVLKPEWATQGVYLIITNERLREEKHGKLKLDKLKELLPADRWPKPAHRNYVIDLMKKFDLCFDAEGEERTVIMPALLKDETPSLADWNPKKCVVLVYKYPVLHHGVVPRFISRTNRYSDGLRRWRSGVELKDDGAEALVKADYDKNRVSIWIRGQHANNRRALLSVIRHEFRAVHDRIEGLNPVERVGVPGHPNTTVKYQDLILDEQAGRTKTLVTLKGRRVEVSIPEMLDGVRSMEERMKNFTATLPPNVTIHDHRIRVEGDVIESQLAQRMRDSKNKPMRSGGGGDAKEG
jgi:internalin A